jgi:hypothetical protein
MYVCVRILYVYVYIYIFVYKYIYIYTYIYKYTYIYIYIYIDRSIDLSIYLSIYLYTYIYRGAVLDANARSAPQLYLVMQSALLHSARLASLKAIYKAIYIGWGLKGHRALQEHAHPGNEQKKKSHWKRTYILL